jgi:hypothetical protein
MLLLIRYVTSNFSTTVSLLISYTTLVRVKFEHSSVAWSSITSVGSNNHEELI